MELAQIKLQNITAAKPVFQVFFAPWTPLVVMFFNSRLAAYILIPFLFCPMAYFSLGFLFGWACPSYKSSAATLGLAFALGLITVYITAFIRL